MNAMGGDRQRESVPVPGGLRGSLPQMVGQGKKVPYRLAGPLDRTDSNLCCNSVDGSYTSRPVFSETSWLCMR